MQLAVAERELAKVMKQSTELTALARLQLLDSTITNLLHPDFHRERVGSWTLTKSSRRC